MSIIYYSALPNNTNTPLSSNISIPRSVALVNLDPAAAPAINVLVFLETLPDRSQTIK